MGFGIVCVFIVEFWLLFVPMKEIKVRKMWWVKEKMFINYLNG